MPAADFEMNEVQQVHDGYVFTLILEDL